jgi:PAS domain S-box-containing protein
MDSSSAELEKRGKESLELRAIELANQVSQLLHTCESDLFTLMMLPRDPAVYREFSINHIKAIWTREGAGQEHRDVHKDMPLFREVAFIDPNGRELVRVVGDQIIGAAELRDVSKPENTTYKSERYFSEASRLKAGKVYVSHVTGWFVPSDGTENSPEAHHADQEKKFEGVVRFATPCFSPAGKFEGIVMVSLDHRHLMEFTQHIVPTDERFVVFPSYSSGNYAFMFDEEGWIICHPKYSDIRGIRPDGSEFDPTSPSYTRDTLVAMKAPFNLDYVGSVSPNYRLISREVRAGRSGVTSTFNVGGISRVMAYAPILYNQTPYDKFGVFGGITIGVQAAKFSEPALFAKSRIDEMVAQTKRSTLTILGTTSLFAVALGIVLARRFTRPILYLAKKAHQIAEGHIPYYFGVRTGDEMELLANNFDEMATEIRRHRRSLERSVDEIAQSKKKVELSSRELEKQLRVLQNVHYLSQYLGTVYDRELALHTILKICVEGLGYDRALLYLYDPASRSLACNQTFGFAPEQSARAIERPYKVDEDDCIPSKVFSTGSTIFVKDVRSDPRATPLDIKIAEAGATDCFVFTPIKIYDRVMGVLGADTQRSLREITHTDVESLEIVANDAARAIERAELHGKLVAERNFIRSIISSMTSGIITLDESGVITWFSTYAETVFNMRSEDALGRPYRDVFAHLPGWIDVVESHLSRPDCAQSGLEYHSLILNGKEKILEAHSSRIEQTRPHQNIVALFIRDVTQRKRMEEHIRRSDRLISLGVLAAGISHEMRNPLTGLSLVMDDLHDRLSDKPRERDLIQRSLQEIDRLENLINGMLDFSAQTGVNRELRPFGDFLESTLFLVRKLCKNQDIALTAQVDDSLPPIRFDPEKLKQALLNLLLNAIQSMPEGGDLRIILKGVSAKESTLEAPTVRIVVKDTGKGIAPEDIPYIFDPFFTRNPSGCGLGLAIVHSIVQEHEGSVSVYSRVGEGTTFCVDLPVVSEK